MGELCFTSAVEVPHVPDWGGGGKTQGEESLT